MTRLHPSTDFAGLLGEHRALLSLARSLVGDAHAAEDLVQETWLVGMRRRPVELAERLRYLRGVLRNLVRRRRRSEQRRLARECAAARPEHEPPTDEWLERVRVQRCMADAVLGLDEPYRETVLLRFWEGLPPRLIAARQGVPVATVHTRLQRALQKLRGQLDRDTVGGRQGWIGIVLAMARRPLPTPVKSSSPPIPAAAQPVLLMTTLFCSILISAWSVLPTTSAPDLLPVLPAEPSAVATAASHLAAPPPRWDVAEEPGAARFRAHPMSLLVLDAHGQPVAGATVRSYLGEYELPMDLPPGTDGLLRLRQLREAGQLARRPDVLLRTPVQEVWTDASGRAVLDCAEPDLRLHVVGPDQSRSGWIGVAPPGSGERVVRLVPGCRLRGVVRDAAGRPATGLTLQFLPVGGVASFSARTPDPQPVGPDGRFDLWVDPHASYVLEVLGGATAELRRLHAEPGAEVAVELRLLGAAHLAVRVVDAAGAALDGAKVRARFAAPEPGAAADTRQSFLPVEQSGIDSLIALPAAGTYEVSGWHAEHVLTARSVEVGYGAVETVTLVASAPRVDVEGVVYGADGQPLDGVLVSCAESRRTFDAPGPCRSAQSDHTGHFRFEGLTAGLGYDFAWHPDHERPAWIARRLGVVAASGGEVVLEPSAPLSVGLQVVDDRTGEPLPGFRYALAVETDLGWRLGVPVEVESEDGLALVDGLHPGASFRIAVEAQGYGRCIVGGAEGQGSTLTARLASAASLTLRVADPQSAAVHHAAVRVAPLDAPMFGWNVGALRAGHTDAEGRFAVDGLGAGRYRIVIDAGAQGSQAVEIELAAGEAAERSLSLAR